MLDALAALLCYPLLAILAVTALVLRAGEWLARRALRRAGRRERQ